MAVDLEVVAVDKVVHSQGRQGDVFLLRIDAVPEGLIKSDKKILALGEHTGHKHQVVGNLQTYVTPGDLQQEVQIVEIVDPATLVHEEHGPHTYAPGVYQVLRQRQINPVTEEIRRVLD